MFFQCKTLLHQSICFSKLKTFKQIKLSAEIVVFLFCVCVMRVVYGVCTLYGVCGLFSMLCVVYGLVWCVCFCVCIVCIVYGV